jgi:hypothetical protein
VAAQQIDPQAPPHNLEAERAVLGSLLLDPNAVSKIKELLCPEDFYYEAHRRIYKTILELFGRGEPVDLITVTDQLHDKDHLNDAGGASYVTALMNSVPTAANVESYARIVLEKSLRRREMQLHADAEYRLRSGEDPKKVAADVGTTMEEIASRRSCVSGHPSFDKSGLTPAFQLHPEPVVFVVQDLLPQAMLALLSGRDKRGKTLFALEIMRAVRRGQPFLGKFAVRQGPVAGFFLDDPEGLTVERLEALGLRDDPEVFISTSRRADLTDPIAFLRDAEHTLVNIRPALVVLDALYLLVPSSRDAANDQARMGPLMARLNSLAESTGAAVLVVAHDSKSGLDVAGSHVIRAAAKTILRLTLPSGADEDPDGDPATPQRVLKVESKLAPASAWGLELRGVGQWGLLGTQKDARAATTRVLVKAYLVGGSTGTVEEIAEAVNRRRADVEGALRTLLAAGEVACEPVKSDGRGRPRQVYTASPSPLTGPDGGHQGDVSPGISVPASSFRPPHPDGNSDDKTRASQAVSRPGEFPSRPDPPREERRDGNSSEGVQIPTLSREGQNFDFDHFVKIAKDMFNAEVISDGPPRTGPWGMPLEDGRHIAFMRMGHALAWVAVPSIGVGEGMQVWRQFALAHSEEEIGRALLTLGRLETTEGFGNGA